VICIFGQRDKKAIMAHRRIPENQAGKMPGLPNGST